MKKYSTIHILILGKWKSAMAQEEMDKGEGAAMLMRLLWRDR